MKDKEMMMDELKQSIKKRYAPKYDMIDILEKGMVIILGLLLVVAVFFFLLSAIKFFGLYLF